MYCHTCARVLSFLRRQESKTVAYNSLHFACFNSESLLLDPCLRRDDSIGILTTHLRRDDNIGILTTHLYRDDSIGNLPSQEQHYKNKDDYNKLYLPLLYQQLHTNSIQKYLMWIIQNISH
jgi:hypothetical protein